jgi:hypothetical protein
MNSKSTYFFVVFMILYFYTLACDVCGSYMGITPHDNKHSFSFLHRYRVFNGYKNYHTQSNLFPPSAYKTFHGDENDTIKKMPSDYSSKDYESFKVFEIRFKYFISKRIEVNVFLPWVNNKTKYNQEKSTSSGFGDLSFNAGYHIILPKPELKFRHRLILGLGIKAPTGNYFVYDNKGERKDFEVQNGTGSWDQFTYLNYVFIYNNLGVNLSLNYKINGSNNYHERLANSQNHFLNLFYKIEIKNVKLFPSIQANYEFTKGLYYKEQLNQSRKMNSLLLGPGIDVFYKQISINLTFQKTVYEEIKTGYLKNAGRFNIGINYLFGKN